MTTQVTFSKIEQDRAKARRRIEVFADGESIGEIRYFRQSARINGRRRECGYWALDTALEAIFEGTVRPSKQSATVKQAVAEGYDARVNEREQRRAEREQREQEILDAASKSKAQLARWYGPHGWRFGDLIGIEGGQGLFRMQTCRDYIPGFGISCACTTRKLPLAEIEVLDPKIWSPGTVAA